MSQNVLEDIQPLKFQYKGLVKRKKRAKIVWSSLFKLKYKTWCGSYKIYNKCFIWDKHFINIYTHYIILEKVHSFPILCIDCHNDVRVFYALLKLTYIYMQGVSTLYVINTAVDRGGLNKLISYWNVVSKIPHWRISRHRWIRLWKRFPGLILYFRCIVHLCLILHVWSPVWIFFTLLVLASNGKIRLLMIKYTVIFRKIQK